MNHIFSHKSYSCSKKLALLKNRVANIVSVVIPTFNEAASIGRIVSLLNQELMQENALINEIIIVDSNSTDNTCTIAEASGARVYSVDQVGPALGYHGKGYAMWKSQFVARGDIIIFLDADIIDFDARFVRGLLGPLLEQESLSMTKAFYNRPLILDQNRFENYGGRVTELMVRPMLSLFFPHLAKIFQPLSGEYALRRDVLRSLGFYSGYSVEIGLLHSFFSQFNPDQFAQVDLESRSHRNRTLPELRKMSFSIMQTIVRLAQGCSKVVFSSKIPEIFLAPDGNEWSQYVYDEKALMPAEVFQKECDGSFR